MQIFTEDAATVAVRGPEVDYVGNYIVHSLSSRFAFLSAFLI